jgi:hypothetical protein
MIPTFEDNRIEFVRFVKENRRIFDELLYSGKYRLTQEFNKSYIIEGYHFLRDFALDDDANRYSLEYDLDDFNSDDSQTDIRVIIRTFDLWLHTILVQRKFYKVLNLLLKEEIDMKLTQINERRAARKADKQRATVRTSQFKDELLSVDYVPDNRPNSVRGKTYRKTRDSWNKKYKSKTGGGSKTKKRHH